jgi:hypothetical protein
MSNSICKTGGAASTALFFLSLGDAAFINKAMARIRRGKRGRANNAGHQAGLLIRPNANALLQELQQAEALLTRHQPIDYMQQLIML